MKTKLIISALFISALTPTFTHAFGNSHTWQREQNTRNDRVCHSRSGQLSFICLVKIKVISL
ncbi:hypothetical protein AB6F55_04020 [Providencia hangzhouensis]